MDLIANLIVAAFANGTHQRLAFDALEHMTSVDRPGWKRLILKHGERYAEGAKAPDNSFKDFTNHVLHPRKNYWGGAPDKVVAWYGVLVDHLRQGQFEDAVYAAGVRAGQSIDAMAVVYMTTTLVWLLIALRFVDPTQIVTRAKREAAH